ncbi:hypothetical protein LARI1_G004770 [Lachnellula arida]|uniref:Zinc finger PHD-type domain-containing protein n=1 Tax=Lachnellula arida TaxID=1316785 RepID=A0A8T9BEM3_9HELO|nr:hypothetical protein LARI1_G004770 [Lachnellula arida]
MIPRGFWNVHRGGKWYQIHRTTGRISSPGDTSTYLTLRRLLDGDEQLSKATPIPFPCPLQRNLDYVYTLDLDSAYLTVSFWHREEGDDEAMELPEPVCMRRLNLDSIHEASDLNYEALLQNGSSPLLDIYAGEDSLQAGKEYEHWETELGQPSSLNELQYRMFMDFVYQWRFFIDDHITWQHPSSALFRRLCYAFLRLAAWDFEISSESEVAKLPLGAEEFPGWDSPPTEIYWFHRNLVVLCEDFGTSSSISDAVSRARTFVGHLEGRGNELRCIFISLADIAFVQIAADKVQCSTVFPLLTNSSTTECSAGFRILTYFLASPYIKEGERDFAAREVFSIALPTEVLEMALNAVAPYDIVSFAQASFMAENWYYASLPQLPDMVIHDFDVSIACCGERTNSEGKEGVCCSDCYAWRHLGCLHPSERTPEKCYICSKCRLSREKAGARPKLIPGAIERANRHGARPDGCRPDGCRVMIRKQEKFLQLRISALRLHLTSMPPNQIDYVVLFSGSWSGLAYGLDDV